MKFTLYNLIFRSHTIPTKFMLGLTSVTWPILEYILFGNITLFFALIFAYGVGILWRILDYTHRPVISNIITTAGAALWTYEAYFNVFIPEHVSSHIILPVIFAAASLWLLLRCGTGEILTKKDTLV